MIKKLLFTLFLVLTQFVASAQINTYTGPNGDWNTASNWSLGLIPTATHDVVIPSGKTVNISSDSFAKTVSVSGVLTISNGKQLTVSGNFTVNSGGSFTMGSGSDMATLIVYGNYVNNGTTNFYKSNVVIAGDLLSPSTSTLQNNGNVVVGGNIIGSFETNGSGTNQIYAVNLYATVTITSTTFDATNVVPGVQVPSSESPALINLVNNIIYGGDCPFTISGTTNVSACSGYNAVFTVSTNGSSPGYQWEVNKNDGFGWNNLADNFDFYSGVTSNTLTVSNVTVAMNSYKYRAKITSASCTKNGNYGTLTVIAGPSVPTIRTITQPTCVLATGSVDLSGLPSSGTWTLTRSGTSNATTTGTGTSVTISGLAAGTYTYAISNGTCVSSASASFIINTQPTTPIVPIIGTITQPTCALATGSVDLSGLPSSGTWTLTQSGTSSTTVTGTGTRTTISGLLVGTYTYKVSNGICTSSTSSNVTIAPLITNTWNGAWSTGFLPTSDQNIIFSASYSSAFDLAGCSCQVTAGAVVFNSGNTLTITNEVTVSGGLMTFENNASLVQTNNNAINSGTITYKRKTTPILYSDYTYWSSPVANQTLFNVSPNTLYNRFFSFNASSNNWQQENSANSMSLGKGYIIHGPQSNLTRAIHEASFVGVPNNGIVSTPIGAIGTYNLIGNPYPSAIDADLFLIANNTVLEGTLYFWTHNTPITNNVYTSDDYAVYNLTGGVGTAANSSTNPSAVNTDVPNGKIAAGQSFFIQSKAAGTATFNNSMRVAGISGNNSQFFKFNTTSKSANALEKHRLWLNLSNSQGAFKQTLVGYVTGATNDYDNSFDGESFDGNQFVDFYSVNQNKNLTIQGRTLPFEVADVVPLGYRTTIDGTFTINIDQADGLLADQAVFIEDKLNNTVFDLKSGDYTFSTVKGTFNDRFELRYTNKSLGTKDFITEENQVLVSNKNKQIKINSPVETIDKVLVYDIAGRQLFQKTNVNGNELSISNLVSSHQTLLVKTVLQNGQTVIKKIIY